MKITVTRKPVETLRPNAWNPNRMDDKQYRAVYHSLRAHGFVVPLVARAAAQLSEEELEGILERLGERAEFLFVEKPDLQAAPLEIVDGEHRWVAAQEIYSNIAAGKVTVVRDAVYTEAGWVHADGSALGAEEIAEATLRTFTDEDGGLLLPVVDLGKLNTTEAQRLTIVLNETQGEADAKEMGRLLKEITQAVGDTATLDLPWDDSMIQDYLSLAEFDWEQFEQAQQEATAKAKEEIENEEEGAWITWEVEMDPEEHDVWQQAKELIQENLIDEGLELHRKEAVANGQVLEALVADFMAG